MIAITERPRCTGSAHERFLHILPLIQRQALRACHAQDPEARDEFIQEVTANSYAAFVRLVERGKQHLAYATPLAQYAIRQVRAGRRVGSRLNVRDISSLHARLHKRITVERLDRFDRKTGDWLEVLVEDRHAGPADTAAARIDVAAWYQSLGRQKRRIAKLLARGETTSAVARRFRLTPGRISQLRCELHQSWQCFQGEHFAA